MHINIYLVWIIYFTLHKLNSIWIISSSSLLMLPNLTAIIWPAVMCYIFTRNKIFHITHKKWMFSFPFAQYILFSFLLDIIYRRKYFSVVYTLSLTYVLELPPRCYLLCHSVIINLGNFVTTICMYMNITKKFKGSLIKEGFIYLWINTTYLEPNKNIIKCKIIMQNKHTVFQEL